MLYSKELDIIKDTVDFNKIELAKICTILTNRGIILLYLFPYKSSIKSRKICEDLVKDDTIYRDVANSILMITASSYIPVILGEAKGVVIYDALGMTTRSAERVLGFNSIVGSSALRTQGRIDFLVDYSPYMSSVLDSVPSKKMALDKGEVADLGINTVNTIYCKRNSDVKLVMQKKKDKFYLKAHYSMWGYSLIIKNKESLWL